MVGCGCAPRPCTPRYHHSTLECIIVYSLLFSFACAVRAVWCAPAPWVHPCCVWCVPCALVCAWLLCLVALLLRACVCCVRPALPAPCPAPCALCLGAVHLAPMCVGTVWLCISVPVHRCVLRVRLQIYPCYLSKLNPQKTGIKSPIFFRRFSRHNFLNQFLFSLEFCF